MERALPITTTLLLDSLRDEAHPEGWEQFSARYWPVLAGFARKLGLGEADAADAAQWTLMEFLKEFRAGRYERQRGRLSSFVVGIARNRILTLRRHARRGAGGAGGAGGQSDAMASEPDSAERLPDDATMTDMWENERRRAILEDAVSQLRGSSRLSPATFRAFELVALRDVPAPEAAAQTGLSVEEVYVARSRCTKRLRELVADLTAAWDEDG